MPQQGKPPSNILLRGSLFVLRRKCGKPNCHCADGDLHESPALTYSLHGRTRILSLRPKDVNGVRAALGRYRKVLAQIEKQALDGIQSLRRGIEQERKGRLRGNRR